MAPATTRSGRPRPAGPPPDAASLREAALSHLARYAATELGLRRVLERRIDRWARQASEAAEPAAAEPGLSNPGPSDPRASSPRASSPRASDPGLLDPGLLDPGLLDPRVPDARTMGHWTSDRRVLDPGMFNPEGPDAGAPNPGTSGPGTSDAWGAGREATDFGSAEAGAIAAQAAAAKRTAAAVVARLAEAGAVSDAGFAALRARSLTRAGRSRLAIAAHLAAKGVDAETARAVLPSDAETELAAALALARRRRIGPFRSGPAPDPAARRRELAVLARAGFAQAVADQALDTDPATAEALVAALRR